MRHRPRALVATAFFLLGPAASAPALSQSIEFANLEGYAVEAVINREQVIRRDGGTRAVRIRQDWTFHINAEQYIVLTVKTTVQTPQGPRTAKPNSGRFTLDEPVRLQDRGGGEAMFKFADGTLTFTRTFPAGAFRVHIAFTRSGANLTCKATEAFAREPGKQIKMESPFGGEITVLESKQLVSTCKIAKKQ